MYKTFFEAIIYGILSVILGLLLSLILVPLKPDLPESCKDWDKYYIMEISLFLVGFFLRYTIEIPIINNYFTE